MDPDRGSRSRADSNSGEPGSKAITLPENAQSHSAREHVPTLDAIHFAEKLAIGAIDLLRVYARETAPKSTSLIQSAQTRLTLALQQLAAEPIAFSRDELREIEKLFAAAEGRFPAAFYTAAAKVQELQLAREARP